jgi:NAD(P)-dependent dehydrogenase (short-subunit alcohol dehydrogenase family)
VFRKFGWPDFDRAALDSFKTNALGNIHLMALFVPLIQKGNLKKVVAISSGMADIDFIRQSGNYAQTPYSMSKAALNLAMAKFHAQYAPEGILFMTLSPGLVDTPKSDSMFSQ